MKCCASPEEAPPVAAPHPAVQHRCSNKFRMADENAQGRVDSLSVASSDDGTVRLSL